MKIIATIFILISIIAPAICIEQTTGANNQHSYDMKIASSNLPSQNSNLKLSPKQSKNFWRKVSKTETCWLWTGAKINKLYGQFKLNGKNELAHRVSWMIHRGEIPKGIDICHNCPGGDRSECVNPDHLWKGTHLDNMRDKVNKGRQSRGPEFSEKVRAGAARGEDSPSARLTEREVIKIRSEYKPGVRGFGPRVLARKFGVSQSTIITIVKRKYWTHI